MVDSCYVLLFCHLSGKVKIKILHTKSQIPPCFVWLRMLACNIKRSTWFSGSIKKRVLKRIFELQREEEAGGQVKVHNEELHNLCPQNIILSNQI